MFTQEQTQQAIETRRQKIEEGREKYKTDFADSESWEELARIYGVRLPMWWVAPEPRVMRQWLRKLGVKERDYCHACGEGWGLEDFARLNPTFPLRAFVGNLLEYREDLEQAKTRLGSIS